jgi:asparagine synthase (glutamine-hydrolysing)
MCGIAGGVALQPHAQPDVQRVERMTDMLAHRGPDAFGTWCSNDRDVAFGHRRLSIIDLAAGGQPMSDETGRFTLIFNGEIYNYRELRAGLESAGIHCRTNSDTEVLLRLLMAHWEEAVSRLVGMFAFAVWDSAARRLLLARDRVGEKPLYYSEENGCLYFASTFGALYGTSATKCPIDFGGLDDFLTLGYVPAPRTIARGISKLPAGTMLRMEDGSVRLHRYWRVGDDMVPFDGTYDLAVDTLEEMLSEAVRIRLRSDVPLGVFLSGGVDSSLVAALAAPQLPDRIRTFSMGFSETSYDETAVAAAVAEHVGSEHRAFQTEYDILDLLPQLVRHYGEPFGDPSALPVWMLARETRRHVTVAVGGDGGDEGFGGYNWYRTAAQLRRVRNFVPARAGAVGVQMSGRFAHRAPRLARFHRGFSLVMAADAERFAALRSFVGPGEAAELYTGELAEHRRARQIAEVDAFVEIYSGATGSDLHRMRVVDIETYLADCLMPKVDVATMAHGLEARAPLLDPTLLRFALSLPDDWLMDEHGGKRILKDVLYRHVPRALFDRPKQGFSVPLDRWFNTELRTRVTELPRSAPLNDLGLLRGDGIGTFLAEHAAGHRDHSQRLYNLLVLEEWLRQNV